MRVRTTPHTPRFGFGFTFQTALSAPCSSMTIPVAPISNTAMPTTVPMTPPLVLLALATVPCTSSAASAPRMPASCSKMRPSAASRPNARPAIDMTSNNNGASEKIV